MIGDLIKPGSVPPQPPRRHRRRRESLFRRPWVRWTAGSIFVSAILALLTFFFVCTYYRNRAEKYDLAKLAELEKSSVVFDRYGDEIGSFYVMENRRPVPLNDVPLHFINALVAEEDSRFLLHHGVDYMGIARAGLATLRAGRVHQGASTITQQLARQGFGMASQRTVHRKLTEIFLAKRIEDRFSKQQILELYLNRIYFGRGFYGVNSAALGYFGKPVNQLTIDESAVLCGLIKSPNRISPLNDMNEAIAARNHVLNRMRDESFLTAEEYTRLKELPIKVSPGRMQGATGYVQAEVRAKLIELLGYDQANTGGYRVYTTVDSELQKAAEKTLSEHLQRIETSTRGYKHETEAVYKQKLDAFLATGKGQDDKDCPKPGYLQGALVAIDNQSGAILTLVGGRDFMLSQYNRAVQGRRPVGTAFLPFVYGPAFENGRYPGTRVKDTPLDNTRVMIGAITGILGEWGSENPQTVYQGDISSRKALVFSRNGAAVRVGSEVGLEKVKDFARRCGIQSPLREENKAFLGSSEMTPAELCLAYSTFAGLGKRPSQLYLITKIEDHTGKVVYSSKAAEADLIQATDEFTAFQVHSCLEQALNEGPGSPATSEYGLGDLPAAGKTGTHSSFTDLWFAGYTTRITCTVWAGLDKPGTIFENAFSNRIALPIWCEVMKAASTIYPAEALQAPPNSETVAVCQRSGLRATDNCYEPRTDPQTGRERFVRSAYNEIVRPGYKVGETCDVHSKRPEGELPFDLPALSAGAGLMIDPKAAVAAASAVPVVVMSPVILSETDPYQSLKPLGRIPKAITVESEIPPPDSQPGKDKDLTPPNSISREKGRLDLKPPEPVRLD
ncbi:MAG: transglycosylase domain-containing protein [Verrucomicrobiales bacterium]